jgi:cold shock CspA family protein
MDLDPSSIQVLREAARNYFFLMDFPSAKECIDKAFEIGPTKLKDKIILNDILLQYYIRKAEHLESISDYDGAMQSLGSLYIAFSESDHRLLDQVMIGHLRKVLPILDKMEKNPLNVDTAIIRKLRSDVEGVSALPRHGKDIDSENKGKFLSGVMKTKGMTDTFAFLRDVWGQEVYISRSSVTEDLWRDMIEGQRVMFEVGTLASGRTFATNVTRL